MVQAQAAQIAVLVAENEALKKRVVELEERRCCTDRLRLPGALLDQITDSIASFTADGAYDQDKVYENVAERHPDAAIIVPPLSTAVTLRRGPSCGL
jgi:hypothetical protein